MVLQEQGDSLDIVRFQEARCKEQLWLGTVVGGLDNYKETAIVGLQVQAYFVETCDCSPVNVK